MSKVFGSSKEVELFHKSLGFNEKFCIAPFTTLLLEPDGKIGACRHKGCEFPVGNILENTFEEIWNGEFIKSWRTEFLNGAPAICKNEVKNVKCNHCPTYSSIIDSTEIKVHQVKKPLRLAFNFNGHCNLECQMCHIWQKPNGLYDQIKFWDQLDVWIENLEEVELLSGEPFIQKDTYRLIDVISEKKPTAFWTITTNANWKMTDFITGKLDKINLKHIIVSLDSLNPESYKVIRKKGDLDKALLTLQNLKKYNQSRILRNLKPFKIVVNFLFQQENWKELGNVYTFSKAENVEIFRTMLYEPAQYSLMSFDENVRVEILEWYFGNLSREQLVNSARVIRPLIDSLAPLNKFYVYDQYHTLVKGAAAVNLPAEFS